MNRTLWKLERIGERLWILASMTASQAAWLASDGKGMAIVAEETRTMAIKVNNAVEKALFDNEEPNKDKLTPLALQINLLALNNAFEAARLGHLGKQAAVSAEEIRNLANEILCLFDTESEEKAGKIARPWPADVMSSLGRGAEFLGFGIDGITFYESLYNIQEVCSPLCERKNGNIVLRSMELPLIDGYKLMGKTKSETAYVIVQTPWAEQNKLYAVAADISGIHFLPIGKPIDVPSEMPLAKYVRECWENENGEPFYFMDWTKMA